MHVLGASVPATVLNETVGMREPDVIPLSATLQEHSPAVSRAIDALRACGSPRHPASIVGGGQGCGERDAKERDRHDQMVGPRSLPEAVDGIMRSQSPT